MRGKNDKKKIPMHHQLHKIDLYVILTTSCSNSGLWWESKGSKGRPVGEEVVDRPGVAGRDHVLPSQQQHRPVQSSPGNKDN